MESSRIFVRDLPPKIVEKDVRKHFSTNGEITSLKIIPDRRIAFVGYEDPQTAAKAAKLYNRTYIRSSKLSVELARPLGSLNSPAAQRQPTRAANAVQNARQRPIPKPVSAPASNDETKNGHLKRKRHIEEAPRESAVDEVAEGEPPAKVQALEHGTGAQGAGTTSESICRSSSAQDGTGNKGLEVSSKEGEEGSDRRSIAGKNTISDEEWLRTHTNRLLDLVDLDEMDATPTGIGKPVSAPNKDDADGSTPSELAKESDLLGESRCAPSIDPLVEKIRQTSRLYVRNLPYSATEGQLSQKYGSFGDVEVSSRANLPSGLSHFVMNPMIGTSDTIPV